MTKSIPPNENPITPFAVTNSRNIRKVFGIKEKNRRGHIYLVGFPRREYFTFGQVVASSTS